MPVSRLSRMNLWGVARRRARRYLSASGLYIPQILSPVQLSMKNTRLFQARINKYRPRWPRRRAEESLMSPCRRESQ